MYNDENPTNRITHNIVLKNMLDKMPVVDSHMHIQGNDIAPIPIMKGILLYRIANALCDKDINQINIKQISYQSSSSIDDKDYDKRNDFISNILSINMLDIDSYLMENRTSMEDLLAKEDFSIVKEGIRKEIDNNLLLQLIEILTLPFQKPYIIAEDIKLIDFIKTIARLFYRKDSERDIIRKIELEQSRIKEEDGFIDRFIKNLINSAVNTYGEIGLFSSYDICDIYMRNSSLSLGYFSHYNIYSEDEFGQADQKKKMLINEEKESFSQWLGFNSFNEVASHYYVNDDRKENWFQFAIMHQMELMYAHYWGAAGIPIYIPYNGKLYFVKNSIYEYYRSPLKLWLGYRKIPINNVYECKKFISDNYKDLHECLITKIKEKKTRQGNIQEQEDIKYFHFLEKVEDDEIYKFEDFEKHLFFHKLAVVKYPFKILSFYHFDPRRFLPEKKDDKHIFLIKKNNSQKNEYENIDVSSIYNLGQNDLCLKKKLDLKSLFIETKEKSPSSNKIFWGIKMYVALGYPPYFGIERNLTKKIFPMLSDKEIDDAENLMKEYYDYCTKHEIPITCHASPQGMTIADSPIYYREFLKSHNINISEGFPSSPKNFMQGIGLIDDFSSPDSWKKVLEKYPKLKICLAHFGGSRFMDGTFFSLDGSSYNAENENDTIYYCWMNKISELIKEYDNVYTDLSCYSLTGSDKYSEYGFSLKALYEYYKEEKITEYKKYNDYEKFKKEKLELKKRNYRMFIEEIFALLNYEGNKYLGSLDAYKKAYEKYLIEKDKHIKWPEKVQAPTKPSFPRENIYAKIYFVANNLKILLNKNKDLKYRIMFGSDWPMFETNESLGKYNGTWFLTIQYLTELMGNKWDAWHQFATINPMKFLGLINESKSDLEEYVYTDSGKDKIKLYKECLSATRKWTLESNGEKSELCRKYQIDESKLIFDENCMDRISNGYDFINVNIRIPSSDKIVNYDKELYINFGEGNA